MADDLPLYVYIIDFQLGYVEFSLLLLFRKCISIMMVTSNKYGFLVGVQCGEYLTIFSSQEVDYALSVRYLAHAQCLENRKIYVVIKTGV